MEEKFFGKSLDYLKNNLLKFVGTMLLILSYLELFYLNDFIKLCCYLDNNYSVIIKSDGFLLLKNIMLPIIILLTIIFIIVFILDTFIHLNVSSVVREFMNYIGYTLFLLNNIYIIMNTIIGLIEEKTIFLINNYSDLCSYKALPYYWFLLLSILFISVVYDQIKKPIDKNLVHTYLNDYDYEVFKEYCSKEKISLEQGVLRGIKNIL